MYTPSILLLLLYVHIRLPMVNVELYNISYISFNSNFLYCWANHYTATRKANEKKEMGRKGNGYEFSFPSLQQETLWGNEIVKCIVCFSFYAPLKCKNMLPQRQTHRRWLELYLVVNFDVNILHQKCGNRNFLNSTGKSYKWNFNSELVRACRT